MIKTTPTIWRWYAVEMKNGCDEINSIECANENDAIELCRQMNERPNYWHDYDGNPAPRNYWSVGKGY